MDKFASALLAALLAGALALAAGCSPQDAAPASTSTGSAGSEAAGSPAGAADGVAAGTYLVEVSLAGGSGRATVDSPTELVVGDDGSMTAVIVWSSPNYDQMVVDGVQYLTVNSSGNSTFEIPVAALDEDLPVQAETTAMSEPHMVDYTLRFDSSTLS